MKKTLNSYQQAEVGGQELCEVLCYGGEHLDVDAEGWEPPDHQHEFTPHQEHPHSRRMVLPPFNQSGVLSKPVERIGVKAAKISQTHSESW